MSFLLGWLFDYDLELIEVVDGELLLVEMVEVYEYVLFGELEVVLLYVD